MSTVTQSAVLPVYARQDLTFVRGEGTTLYDAGGRAYLDFLSGFFPEQSAEPASANSCRRLRPRYGAALRWSGRARS